MTNKSYGMFGAILVFLFLATLPRAADGGSDFGGEGAFSGGGFVCRGNRPPK